MTNGSEGEQPTVTPPSDEHPGGKQAASQSVPTVDVKSFRNTAVSVAKFLRERQPSGYIQRSLGSLIVQPVIRVTCDGKTGQVPLYPDGDTDGCELFKKALDETAKLVWSRVPPEVLERALADLLPLASRLSMAFSGATEEPPKESTEEALKAAEKMLKNPELEKEIAADLELLGVAGDKEAGLLIYLTGTSRLCDEPLACIVQGPSASGKSYVIRKVASLFPPACVIQAHSLTRQALVYAGDALRNAFLVCGERAKREDADATRALRELLADGFVTRKTSGAELRADGPVAYVESTTTDPTEIFGEDFNRCLLKRVDASPEQTATIVKAIADRKSYATDDAAVEAMIAKHRAAQLMLKRCRVVIPFAGRLAELFTKDSIETRRRYPQVLSLVESIALLRQLQRLKDPQDGAVIRATSDDYALARRLLVEQKKAPPAKLKAVLDQLRDLSAPFSTKAVSQKTGANERTVRRNLEQLVQQGWLKRQPGNSRSKQYLPVDQADTLGSDLPATKDLGDYKNVQTDSRKVLVYKPPGVPRAGEEPVWEIEVEDIAVDGSTSRRTLRFTPMGSKAPKAGEPVADSTASVGQDSVPA